jgi:hypothetical protein
MFGSAIHRFKTIKYGTLGAECPHLPHHAAGIELDQNLKNYRVCGSTNVRRLSELICPDMKFGCSGSACSILEVSVLLEMRMQICTQVMARSCQRQSFNSVN